MSEKPTAARESFGNVAPKLAELSDEVLFGDIWATVSKLKELGVAANNGA